MLSPTNHKGVIVRERRELAAAFRAFREGNPHHALVDARVRLLLSVGAQAASVPATSQARVLHLLLQALRSRRRVQEVLAVPIVPALVGRSERRFLPLSALEGAR